jgi:hypothetical protein
MKLYTQNSKKLPKFSKKSTKKICVGVTKREISQISIKISPKKIQFKTKEKFPKKSHRKIFTN